MQDADEPLGKLQRGLGSGFLWAVEADRPHAIETLVRCVVEDPRWDTQLDSRDDYYATLALTLGLDVARLEDPLRREEGGLLLSVLGRMAIRGHGEARRAVRDYVAYGEHWRSALDRLSYDYALHRPVPRWEEAVAGLDRVLLERFPDPSDLARGLPEWGVRASDPPWSAWTDEPRIAGAVAASRDRPAKQTAKRTPKPRPVGEMDTAELLAVEHDSRYRKVRARLATRTGREDLDRILEAARTDGLVMRPAALFALGVQARPELLELAEALTDDGTPALLRRGLSDALTAMPIPLTHDLAHRWLREPGIARRRMAASILAANAGAGDVPELVSALAGQLARQLDADQYMICSLAEALGRNADAGPYPELRRAYAEMPYSYGRRWVVRALAATDPAFPSTLAVECLWDCESDVRVTAAESVERDARAERRLAELAADELEHEWVRRAARDG